MELQEKLELVKRNTAEVVTEAEIEKLLSEKKSPLAYCGYEPSGEVHLGHLVTITKLLDLQKAGFKVKVLLADWHAWLNKKGDWQFIKENCKLWEKTFKKSGLEKAEFVLGSGFQQEKDYVKDVLVLAQHTTLNRATRAMQEVARDLENASVSQMIYPLMQIADMKYLKVDVAQSGIEQRKIHMLARENLQTIGCKTVSFVHTPLVNSLLGPGQKMSSSVPNSLISMRDSEQEISAKLKKAYCPEGVVENNPVLEIARLVVFPRIREIKIERPEKFGGNASFADYAGLEKAFAEKTLHPADLKPAIAIALAKILK
ncbi:MAG: tyrosine--tRNA ligase [Candidatus Diapherotrites archaeon]|nr:tyrosine--tRNA ligase [Candidatus Diapherotrites archaeon]